MIFALSRKAIEPNIVASTGKIPWIVYFEIILFLCLGAFIVIDTIRKTIRGHKFSDKFYFPFVKIQPAIWLVLIIAAVITIVTINLPVGLIILLSAQVVPFRINRKYIDRKPAKINVKVK